MLIKGAQNEFNFLVYRLTKNIFNMLKKYVKNFGLPLTIIQPVFSILKISYSVIEKILLITSKQGFSRIYD